MTATAATASARDRLFTRICWPASGGTPSEARAERVAAARKCSGGAACAGSLGSLIRLGHRTENSWRMANRDGKQQMRSCVVRSDLEADGNSQGMAPMYPVLHDIPHLREYLPELPTYESPLAHNPYFHAVDGFYVTDTDMISVEVAVDTSKPLHQAHYRRAGPRERVYYKPDDVKAAIVTCGGVCPGINTVIRELVNTLCLQYGVKNVRGVVAGYRGFYGANYKELTPKVVDDWHKRGGTMLCTTRGGFDLNKIVDSIEARGLNQVYIIGGDGTMRGATTIFDEVKRRKLKVSVVGIPKTVDNDVGIIDRSFGFQTAVEAAQAAINAAHTEAESTPNCIGLVKLMGRYSGHIAVHATLSNRDVDCCLIPEVPFFMEGKGGLLEFLNHRIAENGHMVIVTAEGAGQHLIPRADGDARDESGNLLLQDVGSWLSKELKQYWKKVNPNKPFGLKYIDPTYMVRAVPSNSADTLYCTLLAHSAVHGAMAGYTGFVAGPVNGGYCYIPLDKVAATQHVVNVNDNRWAWIRSINNQPDFVVPAQHTRDNGSAAEYSQAHEQKQPFHMTSSSKTDV